MTIPEPSYITEAEVEANTLLSGLAALDAANVKKLIQRAEGHIDAYVGPQIHHPDDENDDRVFPREQDFDPDTFAAIIPLKVSQACLAQVEYLYREWWSKSTTAQEPMQREVKSERIGGDGSYAADYAGPTRPDDMLCDQAKAYLSGFVSRFVPLSVTDPDDVPPPT